MTTVTDTHLDAHAMKDDNESNNSEVGQETLMIPVFSEWTQLQIQEAEKKQVEQTNSTEQQRDTNDTLVKHQNVKMRQKNYASPDCGAKVLASNAEAQSTSSVLTEKDEYLLNPCTARIWFVVELCDSIQAQRVELANYELFSSPLKSVSISVSNRFPTREWIYAGQFDAKSERDVQVIELSSTLFGKFVRVDLTYTNTEHYCPLSFFRIFGTSEIEAFEVENEPSDRNNVIDDEEEFEQQAKDKVQLPNKENLLNRAGAAVMSIVHKAAEVLAKTNENDHKLNETGDLFHRQNCVSLSHTILCHKCSENEKRELNEFMSCKSKALSMLLSSSDDILNHLINSEACSNFLGFSLISSDLGTNKNFVTLILPWKYIAAMCNLVATNQKSLALRVEDIPSLLTNIISKKEEVSLKNISKKGTPVEDPLCQQELYGSETTEPPKVDLTGNESQEKQDSSEATVKTVNITETGDDLNIFNVVDRRTQKVTTSITDNVVEPSDKAEKVKDEEKQVTATDTENDLARPTTNTSITESNEGSDSSTNTKPVEQIESKPSQTEVKAPQIETKHSQVEVKPPQPDVKVDQNELKLNGDVRSSNPPESVFLRLSNRIKTLEKNMSLSSQYLEELSRRYKKQIEEVQLSFSKLQASVEDQNSKRLENDRNITRERKRLNEDIFQMSQKMDYMEVILITLSAFFIVQTILVVAVFRRISIYRTALAQHQSNQYILDSVPSSPTVSEKGRSTARKRSKQRTRKISAPNILTQRSNGHSMKNEFQFGSPVLCRTVSAPNKVNTAVMMNEDKENYDEMKAMLEENDDILIPGFEDLKLNNEDELENKDFDTASTASAVSNLTKNESSSIKSFKFKRRLSSPFQLKKPSIKKSTSDRSNEVWTRKAASEGKSYQDDDGSVKFKKSNSFKKLFKKLF